MKLFTCKVRIMGEVKDEVRRNDVTNAEIKILKSIHGEDGVVDVEPMGKDAMTAYPDDEGEIKYRPRSEAEERARLEMFYGEPAVAKLFGVAKPSILDEIADVPGAVIPIEPPVRAEPRRVTPASKTLQLEDVVR